MTQATPEKYPDELRDVLAQASGALRALARHLDSAGQSADDIQRLADRCAAFAGVKVQP